LYFGSVLQPNRACEQPELIRAPPHLPWCQWPLNPAGPARLTAKTKVNSSGKQLNRAFLIFDSAGRAMRMRFLYLGWQYFV
jgi:hypothetical protein